MAGFIFDGSVVSLLRNGCPPEDPKPVNGSRKVDWPNNGRRFCRIAKAALITFVRKGTEK
jgi:hypothetical protein